MRVDVKVIKGYQIYLDNDGLFCIDLNNGQTAARQSFLGICNVISGIAECGKPSRRAISVSKDGDIRRVLVMRQGNIYSDVRLESDGRHYKIRGELFEPNDEAMTELVSGWAAMESERTRLQA